MFRSGMANANRATRAILCSAFDTGGGSAHITQSLTTIARHAPPGKSAPDCLGAIGVTTDSVEGTDINVPVYQFGETHYISNLLVTPAYKANLFHLTGRVNSDRVAGLRRGRGAVPGRERRQTWRQTTGRLLSASPQVPNVTGLVIGSINGIDKRGWEYVWVRYSDVESASVLVKQPIAAYVEQVYRTGNFLTLGIGA